MHAQVDLRGVLRLRRCRRLKPANVKRTELEQYQSGRSIKMEHYFTS